MSKTVLQRVRFSYAQETRLQAAKRLDMGSADLQESSFPDYQE
jgi:hypothetical protein